MKKMLCLHGYGMNSQWLQEWLWPIEQQLEGVVRFIHAQGPIVAPTEEVRAMAARFNAVLPESRIGEGKNWCWYRADDAKPPIYHGIEASLAYLANIVATEGPVEGVLGWSQGAVMAAILAGESATIANSPFGLRWAILCGGFRPGDRRFRPYFDRPLALPTLHVLGEQESEFMRQQGHKLYASFVDAQRLDTPVGHIMPVKYPAYMKQISAWIDNQVK
ncbi:MAG: ovarian cancer-associated protein 2 protein [Halothiobacillaceae bacterium]|nr:MAG: ovarian cancer-associated protein 2 protein [Halothiobacillaceae bacterium]